MRRIRGWWGDCPDRCQSVLRWGIPLLGVLILVALDWWRYRLSGVATPDEARTLFLLVGSALLLAAAFKLILTTKWTVQDVGWVVAMIGVGGLFVRILGRWGRQPVGENERDAIQASLDVGAILLLIGLAMLAWSRWRQR